MKILVLSSYTGERKSNPPNPITRVDFRAREHYELTGKSANRLRRACWTNVSRSVCHPNT